MTEGNVHGQQKEAEAACPTFENERDQSQKIIQYEMIYCGPCDLRPDETE